MTPADLRKALSELQGRRTALVTFVGLPEPIATVKVENAMLVPEEDDHLVKLTDGRSITILDAERVAYVRIAGSDNGLK